MNGKYLSLFVFILITLVISGLGGLVTAPAVEGWYSTINKPSFNPPNWVFAPVWTALYIMIAISGWLVWNKLAGGFAQKIRTKEMQVYAAQLAANFAWSFLFFGMANPLLGLIDIYLLLALIGLNIWLFAKVSKTAAYLLAPYFIWVGFASTLNLAIVFMN